MASAEDNNNSPSDDERFAMNVDLSDLSQLIESLLREIKDNSVTLATFNAELQNLRETVRGLSGVIKDGNGKESLLTRVSLLENEIESARKLAEKQVDQIEKLKEGSQALVVDEHKGHRELVGKKWAFWGAVVAALLGLGASVFNLFSRR